MQVLSQPLPAVRPGGASSFWTAVDVVVALPVSWFPLAGDYTRHARTPRTALLGSALGYGAATVAFFTLGVLALSAYGAVGLDVIDALLAVPLGLLAVLLLVAVEVDEVFANVYSTAVSAQNLAAALDRRVLAVAVGVVATVLALTFDITSYEPFLFLIGAVFVPLAGVLVVAYYLVPRGAWDVSDTAPARPLLLLPWVAGFVAYQLTLPTYLDGPGAGWTAWWAARQADLGIPATNGLSASLVSLTVATVLTALVTVPAATRARAGRDRAVRRRRRRRRAHRARDRLAGAAARPRRSPSSTTPRAAARRRSPPACWRRSPRRRTARSGCSRSRAPRWRATRRSSPRSSRRPGCRVALRTAGTLLVGFDEDDAAALARLHDFQRRARPAVRAADRRASAAAASRRSRRGCAAGWPRRRPLGRRPRRCTPRCSWRPSAPGCGACRQRAAGCSSRAAGRPGCACRRASVRGDRRRPRARRRERRRSTASRRCPCGR